MNVTLCIRLHDLLLNPVCLINLFFGEIPNIICSVIQTLLVSGFLISKLVIVSIIGFHKLVQRRTLVTRLNPGLVGFGKFTFFSLFGGWDNDLISFLIVFKSGGTRWFIDG